MDSRRLGRVHIIDTNRQPEKCIFGSGCTIAVDRDIRLEYIDVLEKADFGPLARLFARLERTAILQALSADVEAEVAQQRALTAAVIDSLATKFQQRRAQQHAQLRKVNDLAKLLRD